jgi:membrane fusion protein (multidrug efflux system)
MKKLNPRAPDELLVPNFWPAALVILCTVSSAFGQTMDEVRVISRPVDRKVELPGEFVPYLSVPIHAKIPGFVDKVQVDRGSVVKEGQLLATMIARGSRGSGPCGTEHL